MTRSAFLTLVATAGLMAADSTPGATPQIPRKSPELIIQLPGKQILLSQFQGYVRVIAFMSTTCPHCQHLAEVLSQLQQEYASKGVQMLGVVFNPEATTDLAIFTQLYAKGMYPVGMSTEPVVANYVQHPPGVHYIPMIAFLDKAGIIRSQHLGLTDAQFFDQKVEAENIRGELAKILKEPVIHLPAPGKAAVAPGKAAVKPGSKKQ
jgi:thiol-disulfide isomerase/thioredoxin